MIILLPAKSLLEPLVIVEAILDALHPLFEPLEGMDCVISARVKMGEHYFPVAITNAHKNELEKLLPMLPKLHGKMTDPEVKNFRIEFEKVSQQSNWYPSIVDEDARISRKQKREHFQREYFLDLKNSVDAGRLIAVNGMHIRCKVLSVGAYIPYKEAVSYLEGSGYVVENIRPPSVGTDNSASQSTTKKKAHSVNVENHLRPEEARTRIATINNSNSLTLDLNASGNQAFQEGHASTPIDLQTSPHVEKKYTDPEDRNGTSKQNAQAENSPLNMIQSIDLPELMSLIRYERTSVYNMLNERSPSYDPSFPKPLLKAKKNSGNRWNRNAVLEWLNKRERK